MHAPRTRGAGRAAYQKLEDEDIKTSVWRTLWKIDDDNDGDDDDDDDDDGDDVEDKAADGSSAPYLRA